MREQSQSHSPVGFVIQAQTRYCYEGKVCKYCCSNVRVKVKVKDVYCDASDCSDAHNAEFIVRTNESRRALLRSKIVLWRRIRSWKGGMVGI